MSSTSGLSEEPGSLDTTTLQCPKKIGTRLVSLSLRHGGPIQHIVQQLNKDEHSDMYSFSRVIGRVLKTYIKDGTKIKSKCPNCGSENMTYQEGCLLCHDCGHSKC